MAGFLLVSCQFDVHPLNVSDSVKGIFLRSFQFQLISLPIYFVYVENTYDYYTEKLAAEIIK